MSKKATSESTGFIETLRLLKQAGIRGNKAIASLSPDFDNVDELDTRIKKVLGLVQQTLKNTTMLYFIMYDIEDNKVRSYIAKYLLKKGCIRLQKSVFLTSSERQIFTEISRTLKEVNEVYNNHDSIVIVPVSTDELKSMRIIGQNKDISFFVDKKNTLFF